MPSFKEKFEDPEATHVLFTLGDEGKLSTKSALRKVLPRLAALTALMSIPLLHSCLPNSGLDNGYALCTSGAPAVYTVDGNNTKVECFVVRGSHFVDTGSLAEIKERRGDALQIKFIDSESIVVPGLTDSHVHSFYYGLQKLLPLESASTVQEAVAKVREYIEKNPEIRSNVSAFIEGWGWDHTKFPHGELPTSAALEADPVTKGRLIALRSKDAHGYWISQRILDSMHNIPDKVEGGKIVRNDEGNPTGVFLDNARNLIPFPVTSEEVMLERWTATVEDAHAVGLTSVHDAKLDPRAIQFFHHLAKTNNLALRVYGMKFFDKEDSYWGNETDKILGSGSDRFTLRSVKFVVDGALRSGGSALYEPYTDNPDSRGYLILEPEVLNDVIPKFLRDGWQVNVHAIGDRANGVVLDAFEAALEHTDVPAIRPRLEHAQILAKRDIPRIGELGVIASIQPTHVIDDMWYAEDRLGPERIKGLYAFRSIIDGGARITLGSDFPVEDMNPLSGFYAAITRVSFDGTSPHGPGGWFPDQRLTRLEALRGITIDPAHASFTENILGSIEVGKRADYVVLSKDIMQVPPAEILQTKVLATAMDGEVVYGQL